MDRVNVAAVAAAIAVAVVAAPVAVDAASNLTVLKDAASDAKARVDGGKLRIGDGAGAVTVDQTWQPFQRRIAVVVPPGELTATAGFEVPQGRRIVLEFASHQSAGGYGLAEVAVAARHDGYIHRNFLDVVSNGGDQVIGQPIQVYGAPGGRIEARFRQRHPADHALVYYLFISGRLLPSS